jgi:hypothetical protein
MKKNLISLILLLSAVNVLMAQNTIAKLKFEDAEEAYAQKDYALTLTKLDDAEAILKATNPKILYLRIMAQSKIIEQKPYDSYSLIESNRTLSARYLKNYESLPNNEDKYRDIYKASEKLNQYPKSAEEFALIVSTLKKAEKDQQKKEEARLARPDLFVDSLLNSYKFKSGLTEAEFIAYNPDAAEVMVKKNRHKDPNTGGYFYFNNRSAYVVLLNAEGKVTSMAANIVCGSAEEKLSGYKKYRTLIANNLHDTERYELDSNGMLMYASLLPNRNLKLLIETMSYLCFRLVISDLTANEMETFKTKTVSEPGFEWKKQ